MLERLTNAAKDAAAGILAGALAPVGMSASAIAKAGNSGIPAGQFGTPIVLVHGCFGSPTHMLSGWRAMRRAGCANISAFAYAAQLGSVDDIAEKLSRHISQQTGMHGQPAVVIGWSLGGLLARWSAEMHGLSRTGTISTVVTLSAPHQGTAWAKLSRLVGPAASPAIRSLQPGSDELRALASADHHAEYLTYGSQRDRVVADESARLHVSRHHTFDGVGHVGIVQSGDVWSKVIADLPS